jgi:hypothetical protein
MLHFPLQIKRKSENYWTRNISITKPTGVVVFKRDSYQNPIFLTRFSNTSASAIVIMVILSEAFV